MKEVIEELKMDLKDMKDTTTTLNQSIKNKEKEIEELKNLIAEYEKAIEVLERETGEKIFEREVDVDKLNDGTHYAGEKGGIVVQNKEQVETKIAEETKDAQIDTLGKVDEDVKAKDALSEKEKKVYDLIADQSELTTAKKIEEKLGSEYLGAIGKLLQYGLIEKKDKRMEENTDKRGYAKVIKYYGLKNE